MSDGRWPKGIPATLLGKFKKQYGSIYTAEVNDIMYVYRPITVEEQEELQDLDLSNAELEDRLVEMSVLWPEINWHKIKAGDVGTLASEVLNSSGFFDATSAIEKLEAQRELLSTDVRTMMKAFIITAMPAYKEEEIDKWSFDQIIDKVVLSEEIFKLHQALATPGAEVKLVLKDITKVAEEEANVDPYAAKLAQAMENL